MEITERSLLLERNFNSPFSNISNSGLSVIFAVVCIVDVFGVFPVVSLPKAIIDCGYLGILVVISVSCIQIYTAILLGKCWLMAEDIEPSIQFKNRYPYSALAEITYGSVLARFVTFLLDLTVFGGGIPNLIVAAQNLQFLGLRLSNDAFDMSFCYWMIVLGTVMCPFLWLGSPKDMKLLCSISVTLVFFAFIFIFICAVSDTPNQSVPSLSTLPDTEFSLWQNISTAYGILAFQFDIHPTILTIQVDMTDKSKIDKAVIGGFAVSLGLFFITCLTILLRYGENVEPSVLEMFPTTVILHFAAVLVALQLSLSSAISNTALYQNIEDSMGISRDFNRKRCIIRSILAILSVLVAESVPRFDLVMSLIGGALTGPLVFILPPLFYIRMLTLKQKHDEMLQLENFHNIVYNLDETSEYFTKYIETKFHKESNTSMPDINIVPKQQNFKDCKVILCTLIIIFGIIATIATTYWNVINTMRYVTFSPPCIFNIYNATL
ncbi:hypothetical protein ILUMI_12418 [Ignelater luminosus]|uniref:Amino acid transporter transmembrane domain-containing protein n=1 Tax=Ignelater luminosus TaxID=2038154 RepID=A0A8K0D2W2_IGNLU|nr:hypothetical protein ILUMI_12418 [Ignelater luminosus]